ncbi:MAG: hypothetical protein M3Q81_03010 [bacterium]|nr:hypothetical protein [bacterium]
MLRMIVIGIAAWLGALFIISQLGRVNSIECYIAEFHCHSELMSYFQGLKGSKVMSASLQTQAQAALKDNPQYKVIKVKRVFPSTVVLALEQQPLGYILEDLSTSKQYGVDQQARVIEDPDPDITTQLFLIEDVSALLSDDAFTTYWHPSLLKLRQSLQSSQIEAERVTISKEKVGILYLASNRTIIFGLANAENDLKKLQYIQESFDFSKVNEPVTEIDVRFKLPVLKTVNSQAVFPQSP